MDIEFGWMPVTGVSSPQTSHLRAKSFARRRPTYTINGIFYFVCDTSSKLMFIDALALPPWEGTAVNCYSLWVGFVGVGDQLPPRALGLGLVGLPSVNRWGGSR